MLLYSRSLKGGYYSISDDLCLVLVSIEIVSDGCLDIPKLAQRNFLTIFRHKQISSSSVTLSL